MRHYRDTLMSIAKHYETGETFPEEIYQKLLAARNFRVGTLSLRQVRFIFIIIHLLNKIIIVISK